MSSSIIDILRKTLAVYSAFLIVFGTVANLITFIICLKKNLRQTPTFVFLSFLVLSDIVCLYFWNLNHFVSTFYGFIYESFSIGYCKFFFTTQLISFQTSAWLLVSRMFIYYDHYWQDRDFILFFFFFFKVGLTVERYLSIRVKNWRTLYFNSKKAAICALIIIAVIFSFNIHLVFTIDYEKPLNFSFDGGCYGDEMHNIWQYV